MLHPAAGLLPVALLTGATAADLLGVATDAPALWVAGAHLELAGVLTAALHLAVGLLAAARAAVRRAPRSRRAAWRLLASGLALLLFGAAWWVRGDASIPPDPAVLLIEPIALALLLLGEWKALRAATAPGRRGSGGLASRGPLRTSE